MHWLQVMLQEWVRSGARSFGDTVWGLPPAWLQTCESMASTGQGPQPRRWPLSDRCVVRGRTPWASASKLEREWTGLSIVRSTDMASNCCWSLWMTLPLRALHIYTVVLPPLKESWGPHRHFWIVPFVFTWPLLFEIIWETVRWSSWVGRLRRMTYGCVIQSWGDSLCN